MRIGACIFGTANGFDLRGDGCLSGNQPQVRGALDLQSFRPEGTQASWFSVPVEAGSHIARLIGQLRSVNDSIGRPGFSGAAVVCPEAELRKTGYAGAIVFVEALHSRFRQACVDQSGRLSWERSSDVFASTDEPPKVQARLLTTRRRPVEYELPRGWHEWLSLPELMHVISIHRDFSEGEREGYILVDRNRVQAQPPLNLALLDSWREILLPDALLRDLKEQNDSLRTENHSLRVETALIREQKSQVDGRLKSAEAALEHEAAVKDQAIHENEKLQIDYNELAQRHAELKKEENRIRENYKRAQKYLRRQWQRKGQDNGTAKRPAVTIFGVPAIRMLGVFIACAGIALLAVALSQYLTPPETTSRPNKLQMSQRSGPAKTREESPSFSEQLGKLFSLNTPENERVHCPRITLASLKEKLISGRCRNPGQTKLESCLDRIALNDVFRIVRKCDPNETCGFADFLQQRPATGFIRDLARTTDSIATCLSSLGCGAGTSCLGAK